MLALTQCWFTRLHVPARGKHREADGSWSGHCRHCEQAIVSWDKRRWYLDRGINLTRLAETTGGRFLYLYDPGGDCIVARYPVGHIEGEAALDAYRAELRAGHGLDLPGCALVLRDSRQGQ